WTITAWPALRACDKTVWTEFLSQVLGLSFVFFVIAIILPAMFDGLEWLRARALSIAVMGAVAVAFISMILALQRAVIKRGTALTSWRTVRGVLIAIPPLLTGLMMYQMMRNPNREPDFWILPFTTYLGSLAILWVVVWAIRWGQMHARRRQQLN